MGIRGRVVGRAIDRARTLSPETKLVARSILYLPQELGERARGRDPLVPPRWLRFVGGGDDFVASGRGLADAIAETVALRPDERVLEVGCGVGRIAAPLTRVIGPEGSWEGFDIVARAIRWCRRNITPRHPNFRFHHADVHNAKYNPGGRLAARAYRFPFADDEFDVVYLTSVFTHMLRPEVEHYTREIGRVLRPGGRAFLTYFLLDEETRSRMAAGATTLVFDVALDGCHAIHAESPEAAVAYEERDVRAMIETAGLRVREPIRHGSWAGRGSAPLTYQDVVLAEKA